VLVLACVNVAGVTAQTVHQIEIVGDKDQNRFRFSPARVTVQPGDVVQFTVRSGPPHSVVFDSSGLSTAQRNALDQAIPDRMSLLSGPLLTRQGQVMEILVPQLPAGSYRFYCLPHRAYRAEGELVIQE
jgi:plastocyanin